VVNEISENIRITIERYDSRHYHYNTVSANVEIIGDDDIEFDLGLDKIMEISVSDICEKIEPIITDWAREKSKELYRNLENLYEELTSDETISSDLESGGYTFDEDGNII
jgi:anaerobic ribonucleoside-triphosphate reductase